MQNRTLAFVHPSEAHAYNLLALLWRERIEVRVEQ
jgi:hypothetical protein